MQLLRSQSSVQRVLTTHAAIHNMFYTPRHLISRPRFSSSVPRLITRGWMLSPETVRVDLVVDCVGYAASAWTG